MKKLTTIKYDPETMQFSTPRKVSKTKEELLQEGAEITKRLVKFRQHPGYTVYSGARYYIADDGGTYESCSGIGYHAYFHHSRNKDTVPIKVLERIVRNGRRRLNLIESGLGKVMETNPEDALEGILEGKQDEKLIDSMLEKKMLELNKIFKDVKGTAQTERLYFTFDVVGDIGLTFTFTYDVYRYKTGGFYYRLECNDIGEYSKTYYKNALVFLRNFSDIKKQIEKQSEIFAKGGEK